MEGHYATAREAFFKSDCCIDGPRVDFGETGVFESGL